MGFSDPAALTSRRWIVVAFIFAGILISYIDRGNLGIAAPSMMRDFSFTPASMGMLLSAFFWTYAFFQLPAGAVVDRFGIRRSYAAAFLLWSVASASIGLAGGLSSIVLLRMLLGLAEAVGPIASLSFIRRNFANADAGLPTAIYIAGQNLGPAAGALLGSQLIVHFGWRAMFIFTGLGALLWLPGWLLFAPRNDGFRPERDKLQQKPPIPWRRAIATRGFWASSACIFLSSYFWYFLLTWVPTYLISSRGLSTTEMGRVLSIALFSMAFVNIAAGFVADRAVVRAGPGESELRVRVWFCAAGYAGSGAILLLLALPGREAVLPVLLFSVCATGIGNSNYWTISQQIAPAHLVGRAIGYFNTISQIAGAAAPLITGWILGPEKEFSIALGIAGIAPVLAAGCLLYAGAKGLAGVRRSLAYESGAEA
jgi:MFS transporter, ACS family, D-galactonate transporter